MTSQHSLRVGAVSYLNTKPLIYELTRIAPDIDLRLEVPSRLADQLATGELDLALIPSVESFQDPDYTIVSDACIGCRGPVLSVKLFSRVPMAQIRTLALDEGSRTSAALTKILLWERYRVAPQCELLPLGNTIHDATTDAVLLIGDRAIHPPDLPFEASWDLGSEWRAWSGLPFVFAMWVGRRDRDWSQIDVALRAARDRGLQHLESIAHAEAPRVRLTTDECLGYLRDNLHFVMGPQERRGLELFRSHAQKMGLVPNHSEQLRFASPVECAS